jgi:hypothetical protein
MGDAEQHLSVAVHQPVPPTTAGHLIPPEEPGDLILTAAELLFRNGQTTERTINAA